MAEMQETIPQRIRNISRKHPEQPALYFRPDIRSPFEFVTYGKLCEISKSVAFGFYSLGIRRGDKVTIVSDNRKEWMFCDLAMMSLGIVDTPRGSDSSAEEVGYIVEHSESKVVVCENPKQAEKLIESKIDLKKISHIILLDGETKLKGFPEATKIMTLEDLIESGKKIEKKEPDFVDKQIDEGKLDDLATIIYTSGTTGTPKGVMLTNRSFIFQLERVYEVLPIQLGHILLSVLPIWHTFERMCEYIILNKGAAIAYSKPTGQILLKDMSDIQPFWFASVPRIWESIYSSVMRNVKKGSKVKQFLFNFFTKVSAAQAWGEDMWKEQIPFLKEQNRLHLRILGFFPKYGLLPLKWLGNILVFGKIKKLLGKNFMAGVSGGGALPGHIDQFFQAAGIKVLEGYGMTETGPIMSVRDFTNPIRRSIGILLKDIEYRVVDGEGNDVPRGTKGKLIVKTPQVMQGYYKREEETQKVLKDGWLDTGDLVVEAYNHAMKIVGRVKETIVLIGGENIEPGPIEEKLTASNLIEQVMVIGQDQRYLGALIVPNIEKLKEFAEANGVKWVEDAELLNQEPIVSFVNEEVQKIVSNKNGFKPYEKVFKIKLLSQPFREGIEMTRSLKIKRKVVEEMYKKDIEALFKLN